MAIYTIDFGDFLYYYFTSDFAGIFPTYTLFEESHKSELQKKVIDHYLYYEIGQETPERFIHEFRTKWLEIIPLANKKFQAMASTDLIKWYNDYLETTYQLDKTGSGNAGKSKTTQSNNTTFMQTPYSNLGNTDYATTKTNGGTSSETDHLRDSTSQSKDVYAEIKKGWNGLTPAEAIKKYMDAIIDVDIWIISQMRECFMEVY